MHVLRSITTAGLMIMVFFSIIPVLGPALIVPFLLKVAGED